MKVPNINCYAHPSGGCHIVPRTEVDEESQWSWKLLFTTDLQTSHRIKAKNWL